MAVDADPLAHENDAGRRCEQDIRPLGCLHVSVCSTTSSEDQGTGSNTEPPYRLFIKYQPSSTIDDARMLVYDEFCIVRSFL